MEHPQRSCPSVPSWPEVGVSMDPRIWHPHLMAWTCRKWHRSPVAQCKPKACVSTVFQVCDPELVNAQLSFCTTSTPNRVEAASHWVLFPPSPALKSQLSCSGQAQMEALWSWSCAAHPLHLVACTCALQTCHTCLSLGLRQPLRRRSQEKCSSQNCPR